MIRRKYNILLQFAFLVIFAFAFTEAKSFFASSHNNTVIEKQPVIGQLTVNKKELSSPGYTLNTIIGNGEIHLLNMSGKSLHHWKVDAERARLLPNCNLMVKVGSEWGTETGKTKSARNTLLELDWHGNLVWEYKGSDVIHHDFRVMPDNSVMFIQRMIVPESYKGKINNPEMRKLDIRSDVFLQIDRHGKELWRWQAHDHLDLNSCGRRPCQERVGEETGQSNLSDWTHINTLGILPDNKWYRAGDQRFKPGNILLIPRNFWMTYLIDKDTGKVVWEYGGDYKGGLSGAHEALMIEEGMPGAGNILVIDNGNNVHYGETFVLEINPQTKEIVWIYDVGTKFWTKSRGSAQRLPNGNTLISEDLTGRVFLKSLPIKKQSGNSKEI